MRAGPALRDPSVLQARRVYSATRATIARKPSGLFPNHCTQVPAFRRALDTAVHFNGCYGEFSIGLSKHPCYRHNPPFRRTTLHESARLLAKRIRMNVSRVCVLALCWLLFSGSAISKDKDKDKDKDKKLKKGDVVEIVGGTITFVHPPIDPDPAAADGICENPPGLFYDIDSDAFLGEIETEEHGALPYMGVGNATGCAFATLLEDGTATLFTGTATFETKAGDLYATFVLTDTPTEMFGVYIAEVTVEFFGGTKKFKDATGQAVAVGPDFPFGGLFGGTAGGLNAVFIAGEIKLRD